MDKPQITASWRLEAEKRRCKRRSLDLTLSVVSQRIGIAESTLHRYERAVKRPSRAIEAEWSTALYKEAP